VETTPELVTSVTPSSHVTAVVVAQMVMVVSVEDGVVGPAGVDEVVGQSKCGTT
jgi:hypothetical protein